MRSLSWKVALSVISSVGGYLNRVLGRVFVRGRPGGETNREKKLNRP